MVSQALRASQGLLASGLRVPRALLASQDPQEPLVEDQRVRLVRRVRRELQTAPQGLQGLLASAFSAPQVRQVELDRQVRRAALVLPALPQGLRVPLVPLEPRREKLDPQVRVVPQMALQARLALQVRQDLDSPAPPA
jgi:hypothetical protein